MKRSSQKLLLLTIIAQAAGLHASATPSLQVAPFVQWRSEGRDTARKLVGTTSHHVYLHDMESFYGTFNVTPQYDQTFRADKLNECYFGSSLTSCNTITIAGTQAPDINVTKDWMAENFYLPRDFKSTIQFTPKVQNFLVDFNLYVGLDEWVKGLYFRLYGPVVNNRVTLQPCESVQQAGTIGYDPGFFSQNEVPADTLLQTALSFFNGCTTITVPGIVAAPLLKAKIADDKKSTTGFAELRGELGWNYLHEDYHIGFNIQAAAPTGKRPHGDYLFETQVGNGKHWELGIGLSGHWTMWRSEDDEKHLDLVLEGDVTHLFNATQCRTFDLIGKPNSRYMLAEQMNLKPTTNLFGNTEPNLEMGTITQASSQFNAAYSPVANFSTRNVNVSIGVQADLVAMINYTRHGFSWDLGYNFWGMSHEDIDLRDSDDAPVFPANTWALKSDAQVYGFVAGNPAVPLSGTESLATINQGTNIPNAGTGPDMGPTTNIGVDNAQYAQTSNMLPMAIITDNDGNQIRTSIQPVFITEDNLDLEGAETRGSSNKIFTHFSYTWIDREDWIPYLGIGFNAEFGNTSHGDTFDSSTCNNDGINCALSKWAVLVKGGVSFD
ncbi:MAG TPA: hypothetical protein VKR54_03380 [Candidatus Babeliales bacterium]|jgi:hypothetical protein|nr:hypothetical protein [Candidatus Babeliales bacterium]